MPMSDRGHPRPADGHPAPPPTQTAPPAQAPPHLSNRLLAALPPDDATELLPQLTLVHLAHNQVLYDVGVPITHVYFPLDALVSLRVVLENGRQVEMAAIGREGLVGLPVALDAETDGHLAAVQIPGAALQLPADALRAALARMPGLHTVLHRSALVLLTKSGQAVACNSRHALNERCARWLLDAHDRVGVDVFPLTQDFLAAMLGVRRPSVTVAAGMLQQAGLISYHRGRVTIRDRERLEAATCTCYHVVAREIDRLLMLPRERSR